MERAGDSVWLFPSRVDDVPMRTKSAMRAILRVQKRQERPAISAAFETWCTQNNRTAYATTPETVADWISTLTKANGAKPLSRFALKAHVSAILAAQYAAGNRISRNHPAIAAVIRAAPEERPTMGAERPGYSTHDLRRTFATGLGDIGVPDEVIERFMNHAPSSITRRHYNHAKLFEPMRCALQAWDRHLRVVIGDPEARALGDRAHPEVG
jgi:integrase